MIRRIQVVTSLLLLAIGVACAEPQAGAQYSHAELQTMINEAHSAKQYQALATYYRSQQQIMDQKAQAERQEWERRSQNTTGISQKYPRPVDSSKNRYEYFTYEADRMGQQAAHYESLSASAPQAAAK
jgi:hypothetical protein